MMTENQFDEYFRKKLADYSSQVPEDMWDRIKQKKDKDKRFILFLSLLLLIGGGISSYFIFSSDHTMEKTNIASVQKHTNTVINKNKNNEPIITQIDPTNSKQESKILSPNDKSKNIVFNSTEANPEFNKSSKKASNDLQDQKEKNNYDNSEPTKNNPEITGNAQQTEANSQNKFEDNIAIKPNRSITVQQNNQKSVMQHVDSSAKTKMSEQASKSIRYERPVLSNLFIEIYASPDIPVSKTTSNNAAYLQHKDSASKMQLSYTFGFRVGATFGEHITGRTGLQYSDINEKFNYINQNATRTIPVVVERTLTTSSGETRTIMDTSDLIQMGKQYKLTYNHYKSLDIPVLIGYQTTGERLKASFNTGIILNLKTTYAGDILDSSLAPVDISSNGFYKNNTGVSLYFGLGVSTKLNNSMELFTEPYIRYRLSDMTATYQPFAQRINVGGLSLGLRYNFKN